MLTIYQWYLQWIVIFFAKSLKSLVRLLITFYLLENCSENRQLEVCYASISIACVINGTDCSPGRARHVDIQGGQSDIFGSSIYLKLYFLGLAATVIYIAFIRQLKPELIFPGGFLVKLLHRISRSFKVKPLELRRRFDIWCSNLV